MRTREAETRAKTLIRRFAPPREKRPCVSFGPARAGEGFSLLLELLDRAAQEQAGARLVSALYLRVYIARASVRKAGASSLTIYPAVSGMRLSLLAMPETKLATLADLSGAHVLPSRPQTVFTFSAAEWLTQSTGK